MHLHKYLKYKSKYLNLKGGGGNDEPDLISEDRPYELVPVYHGPPVLRIGSGRLGPSPSQLHLVWIGNPMASKNNSALLFFDSLRLFDGFNLEINYWTDDESVNEGDLLRKIGYDRASKGLIRVNRIRDAEMAMRADPSVGHAFETYKSLYDLLAKRGKYNYIKEILSLAILYLYGGYYIDTTTLIVPSDAGRTSELVLPDFDAVLLPQISANNYDYDVFFYYAPRFHKLVKLMLIYMLNLYDLVLLEGTDLDFEDYDEFKSLVKLRFDENDDINGRCTYSLYNLAQGECKYQGRNVIFETSLITAHVRCLLRDLEAMGLNVTDRINSVDTHSLREGPCNRPSVRCYRIDDATLFIKHFALSGWTAV